MTLAAAEQRDSSIVLPDWVYDALEVETPYHEFYVTKGLGAGGTYGLALWHYLTCLENQDSRFSWAIAPTYQQVVDTLIPTFTEVFQNVFGLEELSDYSVVISQRPRILIHGTGQEIHFKSANRPDRMVGPSISHLSGTEPGLWPQMAFEKSSARVRCKRSRRLQKLYEGTPEGLGNHWDTIANIEEGTDTARNRTRIVLWTEDNPNLPPGYINNLKRTYEYDPAKLESYLYGNFVAFTKGTAYWEFFESRNVVLNVKPSPYLPLIMTLDFGVQPLAWVAIQRQPHKTKWGSTYQRFVALEEGSGNSRGVMDAASEFVAKFDPAIYRDTPIEIDGGHDGYHGSHLSPDCAFSQVYQVLAKYYKNVSVVASKAAPTRKDRLNKVAALMAYERYVVAAWCRNLIKSHTQSSLKPGTWELEKKGDKDPTHFADAACNPIFRLTRDEDLINPNSRLIYGTNKQF